MDRNEFKACLGSFCKSAEAYIAEHGEEDAWRVLREVPGAVGALSDVVAMVEKVESEKVESEKVESAKADPYQGMSIAEMQAEYERMTQ
jgi:hypothetical protein